MCDVNDFASGCESYAPWAMQWSHPAPNEEGRTDRFPRGRDKIPCCQVPGCTADLRSEKLYSLRKRICGKHMAAPALHYPGNAVYRYCFQCAKLEPLQCFDGPKRSCRLALHKRKVRTAAGVVMQNQQTAAAAAAGIAAAAAVPGPPMLIKSNVSATSLEQQLQQQVQLVQLQQQLQQQQQPPQAFAAAAPDMEEQLATAAATLSAVANLLVGTRTEARMRTNSIHARSLVFQQQQQQQQLQHVAPAVSSSAATVPDNGSRTVNPNRPGAGAAAAAVVGQDAEYSAFEADVSAATAAAAAAAAAANDSDFDSFLETLLRAEDVPASSAQASQSEAHSCSRGSASLAATLSPCFGQPGIAALPAALLAPAATDMLPKQASLASMQMPLPGFAGNTRFAVPTGFRMTTGPGFPSLGAGKVPGMAASSFSTGTAASLAGAFAGVNQRRTAEHLQSLNAMLQQVQSNVLALAQNIQAIKAAQGMHD